MKRNSIGRRLTICSTVCITLLSLTACEKVIQVDLDKVEKKYVIEATLSDQAGSCRVFITETKNFDDNNTFNRISGAEVTIADDNGTPQRLTETSAGTYELPSLVGIPLHSYNLRVTINGKQFTATSTMPARVTFDSLFISERTFFDETNKYATIRFRDPAGIKNAYRFIQYVNGVKEETIFVRDDNATDGVNMERPLIVFYDDDQDYKKLKSGDQVKVEMLCISYQIYKYWYSLTESATGENQSNTPGNPLTNIQGGALGYFSAQTLQSRTVTVP